MVGGYRSFVLSAGLLAFAAQAAAQQAPPPASPSQQQQPPAPSPAAPPAPAPATPAGQAPAPAAAPMLTFASDVGLVIFTVKAEGAADFEAFFAKVKQALEQSKKPEYKSMASGWTLFKVADMSQSGQVLYASLMDPVVKGADYDFVKILTTTMPTEATALYPKLKDALVSINKLSLQTALKMGPQ